MLDKKYNFQEKDEKWQNYWQEKGTYKFRITDVAGNSIEKDVIV